MKIIPTTNNKQRGAQAPPDSTQESGNFKEMKQLIDQLNRQQAEALKIINQYPNKSSF